MSEKFDFSKIENQNKFNELPKEEKEKFISEAQEEATGINDFINNQDIDGQKLSKNELIKREECLLSCGFSKKMVEKLKDTRPSLYKKEVIDSKIAGLKERGFSNPQKIIETLPAIFGYRFDNID